MSNIAGFNKRRAVIVSIMMLIALTHIIDIGRHLQGTLFDLFKSYFSDIVLPFGFYFLLSMNEQRIPVLKRWEAKLLIMFVMPSIAETCQYFGIPVLGSTFDPLDYLMYAIGAIFAAIVDRQVFPRSLNFWPKEKVEGP